MLTVSEAIESLGAIFAAEEPLDEVLSRVVRTAAKAMPGADAVSITVFGESGARSVTWTDDVAQRIDEEQ